MKYKLANPAMDEFIRKFFTAEEIDANIEQNENGVVHFNLAGGNGYYLFSFSVRDVVEVGGD